MKKVRIFYKIEYRNEVVSIFNSLNIPFKENQYHEFTLTQKYFYDVFQKHPLYSLRYFNSFEFLIF